MAIEYPRNTGTVYTCMCTFVGYVCLCYIGANCVKIATNDPRDTSMVYICMCTFIVYIRLCTCVAVCVAHQRGVHIFVYIPTRYISLFNVRISIDLDVTMHLDMGISVVVQVAQRQMSS